MKTVKIKIPIELVLPIEYDIRVRLDGDNSHLSIKETFPADIPSGMVERTVSLAKELYSGLFGADNVKISKISDYEVSFELQGDEKAIAGTLYGEFDTLHKGYFPEANTLIY